MKHSTTAVSAASQRAQTTNRVLMIRPRHFFSNPETAQTNEFQSADAVGGAAAAIAEFDGLVAQLHKHGVDVVCFDASVDPVTPDAVFPNNWLSTHSDGTVVTYPMQPVSRRAERRADIIDRLRDDYGFAVHRHLDLAVYERDGKFLEGTGSLVLDRAGRRAFACLSARTDAQMVALVAKHLDCRAVTFSAHGPGGHPVYHTNVMMCIGRAVIVACVEAIAPTDRDRVVAALERDHELVPISMAQMNAFAGNMLEVVNRDGEPLLLMSTRARSALDAGQCARLERHARLVSAPIDVIENAAGGSVRCMLAEIFLPKASTF